MSAGSDSRRRSVRVVVADRHAVARAAIGMALAEAWEIELVGAAADLAEAVALVERAEPDVVLLDSLEPGQSNVEALAALLAAVPRTKVVLLALEHDRKYARRALAAGASGYLLKERAGEEVVPAVRAVAAGRRYVSPLDGER